MILIAGQVMLPPGNNLNNREWATLIWLAVGVAWVLSRKDMRPIVASLLRTATHPVLLVPAVALWTWTVLIVWAVSRLHLWTGDLVKDTVIWSIGPALGLYYSVTKVANDPKFFRHAVMNTIRFTVLIEFYINLRVFSLPVELIVLPAVTMIAMLGVVAGRDARYRSVKVLIDTVTSIVGLALLVYVTFALIGSWRQEDLGHDLRDIALPVWLTIGALPFLYALSLFSGYQAAFRRIDWWTKTHAKAARRAKLALMVELNARTHLVNQFGGHWFNDLAEAHTFADAREVVRGYRAARVQTEPPSA